MDIKYLSVCSGVEAASLAWRGLGWRAMAFAEVEPYPAAVLASRFPDVPNLGDISALEFGKDEVSDGVSTVSFRGGLDLLVGGTPCQSFSCARQGRAGLEGKSGLALAYVRILSALRPRWFVWENVVGAISSISAGRRDFNFLLASFAECGYDVEWRVLDAVNVFTPGFPRGLPQRRPRVFVVGRRAGLAPFPVLCEPETVRGNLAADGEDDGAGVGRSVDRIGREVLCTTAGADVVGCLTNNLMHGADMISAKSGMLIVDRRFGDDYFPIRRPSVLEAERLMGFPDGWTMPTFTDATVDAAIPRMRRTYDIWARIAGKKVAPSERTIRARLLAWSQTSNILARYKCCGNSMCVNCMEWLGRRIEWAEARAERIRNRWR